MARRRAQHPLIAAIRRALRRSKPPATTAYLALLNRRLAVLAALASKEGGRGTALPRSGGRVARAFLKPLEGTWDDGDENLVRGYLDRWVPRAEEPVGALARSLTEAADALARLETRPATLWFFLWEMESMLESLLTRTGRPEACDGEADPRGR